MPKDSPHSWISSSAGKPVHFRLCSVQTMRFPAEETYPVSISSPHLGQRMAGPPLIIRNEFAAVGAVPYRGAPRLVPGQAQVPLRGHNVRQTEWVSGGGIWTPQDGRRGQPFSISVPQQGHNKTSFVGGRRGTQRVPADNKKTPLSLFSKRQRRKKSSAVPLFLPDVCKIRPLKAAR